MTEGVGGGRPPGSRGRDGDGESPPAVSEIARRGESHWAGEPVQVWEQRWDIPLLEAHQRLASTNDRLRELARAGAPALTVVLAEEQTAGRGRGGRRWHSPPGRGLWMSVLLPEERSGRPPLTPLLVGLAVSRAVREAAPGVLSGIKWPNDVVVGNRKLAGVLCEGEPGARTVAGIGINVHGECDRFPAELRETATTLEQEIRREVRRSEVAGAVLRILRPLLGTAPDELSGDLARELEELDVLRGRLVETDTGLRGRGRGIGSDGALLVERPDGRVERVRAGSVRLDTEGEP